MAQRPQGTLPCPRCQGKKEVVLNGRKVICPACRGTGKGGYWTKGR